MQVYPGLGTIHDSHKRGRTLQWPPALGISGRQGYERAMKYYFAKKGAIP